MITVKPTIAIQDNRELTAAEALVEMCGGYRVNHKLLIGCDVDGDDEVGIKSASSAVTKRKFKTVQDDNNLSYCSTSKRLAPTLKRVIGSNNENLSTTVCEENYSIDNSNQKATFPRRTEEEKREMLANVVGTLDEEDFKYLRYVLDKKQINLKPGDVRILFGSEEANKAHLSVKETMIEEEKILDGPKWWSGCSRCDIIETDARKEKVCIEEATDGHVIQAFNLTRRDQRGDTIKMDAVNLDVSLKIVKLITESSLLMRAKNLRFSPSKINTCIELNDSKNANGGDMVIQHVAEKVRPCLAQFRGRTLQTSLPDLDGSSYFYQMAL